MSENIWLAILSGAIAANWFFFTYKYRTNDEQHRDHYSHASDLGMHQTDRDRISMKDGLRLGADELLRHIQQDEKHFDATEARFTRIDDRIEKRFDLLDMRFEQAEKNRIRTSDIMDARFEQIAAMLKDMNK